MHSNLLETYFHELKNAPSDQNILDLACGEGRNGLFLAQKGLPVTFADHSESALSNISNTLNQTGGCHTIWPVDLELPDINPFAGKVFSSALIFRYLHRPIIPFLINAVAPGGIVVYETFTLDNKQFGRPNNPQFLLKQGELQDWFNGWETLHYFEGILPAPDRAVAQIVCRKPKK
mgnify:FL=1